MLPCTDAYKATQRCVARTDAYKATQRCVAHCGGGGWRGADCVVSYPKLRIGARSPRLRPGRDVNFYFIDILYFLPFVKNIKSLSLLTNLLNNLIFSIPSGDLCSWFKTQL